jgi:hypothetical protein
MGTDGRGAPCGRVDASRRSQGVKARKKLGVEPEGMRCGARLLRLADQVAVHVMHGLKGEVLRRARRRTSEDAYARDDATRQAQRRLSLALAGG